MSPTSYQTALSRDIKMAEKEGFEPPRDFHHLPVFKTGPFNHLGISPFNKNIKLLVDPTGLEPVTNRL